MTCPQCGSKTAVKDCRSQEDSKTRRRVCFDCGYKFNTIEIDMDYYLKLMPVDTEAMKKEVQSIVLAAYSDFTKKIYEATRMTEREWK